MSLQDLLLLLVGASLVPLVISFVAGFVVRRWAPAWNLVDQPNVQRKVHTVPTPLGGGVAIWLGVVATFAGGQLVLALISSGQLVPVESLPRLVADHLGGLWQQSISLWILLAAGTVLMLTGLADDRRGLPWQLRLGIQFAVAIGCVAWEDDLRVTAFMEMPYLTGLLSVLWIVGLINSFNMLDNMDGLSGGVAVIASGFLAAVLLLASGQGTQHPQLFVAGLLLVVAGAVVGFLLHNRPPARLFMGDAGAYFVGFFVAVATLLASFAGYREGGPEPHAILAPVFVMAVPLYDMLSVLWIRLRSGRSPFAADKNHFSHRLVDLGMSKGQAVLTIYLTTATCGLCALLLHRVDSVGAGLLTALVLSVLTLIAILESTARRKLQS